MKFIFHTNCISPHQLPLAKELVALLGADEYCYLYDNELESERIGLGWSEQVYPWTLCCAKNPSVSHRLMLEADVLFSGMRDIEVFEQRALAGRLTFYTSERWFKPISVLSGLYLPGSVRMLWPSYSRMACRMASLLRDADCFRYFPMGPWAKRDMETIGVPSHKMTEWGYFVEPSDAGACCHMPTCSASELRVFWCGRMLKWKRVDTIIKALVIARKKYSISLTIAGEGVERNRIVDLVSRSDLFNGAVEIRDPIPIAEVRREMRRHDVYVLASDASEGWGAVVNEALAEGMRVLGTYEAGASAAMLTNESLFHAGDYRALEGLLCRCAEEKRRDGFLRGQGIGQWDPRRAARRLLALCE